jgi:hypothetical protein
MKKIDIAITATLRPDILETTLDSFCEKMLYEKNRYRLIINIDPIGEKIFPKFILKIAQKYFDDIVHRYSPEPGFTKAVMWSWSKIKYNYLLYLQDDWRLLKLININNMIETLDNNPKLASLRLNKNETPINNGDTDFTLCPRISLNPILFKYEFIKGVTPLMTPDENPEKQLRPSLKSERGRFIRNWEHGIYIKESRDRIVDDIGRKWMNKTIYKKEAGFTKWEIKDENQ